MPEPRVLIVDDEPKVRLFYRATFEIEKYVVLEAASAANALELFKTENLALAILDYRMPEMNGLQLLAAVRREGILNAIVMITAYGDIPNAVQAMKLGAIDFLEKPVTPEELRGIAREVLERHAEWVPESPLDRSRQTVEMLFQLYLKNARRLINLQDFSGAQDNSKLALEIFPHSREALKLQKALGEITIGHPNE
jgi:DNA-binding NtrC family response regulator